MFESSLVLFTRLLRNVSKLSNSEMFPLSLYFSFKPFVNVISRATKYLHKREKPENISAKLGQVKCCQAIENSIAVDCFQVRNIEDIFQTTLTEQSPISTNFEVLTTNKLPTSEENKATPVVNLNIPRPNDVMNYIRKEEKNVSKTEAKDFLGPLREITSGFLIQRFFLL